MPVGWPPTRILDTTWPVSVSTLATLDRAAPDPHAVGAGCDVVGSAGHLATARCPAARLDASEEPILVEKPQAVLRGRERHHAAMLEIVLTVTGLVLLASRR